MHGGGFVNVTRGGILYLQSQGLGTAINTISTSSTNTGFGARFGLDVLYNDVMVVGVNLIDIGDPLRVWIAYGTEGDGNWDNTESHTWVAL